MRPPLVCILSLAAVACVSARDFAAGAKSWLYDKMMDRLFVEMNVHGEVVDVNGKPISNVVLQVEVDGKQPEQFESTLPSGTFSIRRKHCIEIGMTFIKEGYHWEIRQMHVGEDEIEKTGKSTFDLPLTVVLESIGDAVDLIPYERVLSTVIAGGKAAIIDVSRPNWESQTNVPDANDVPECAFSVLPNTASSSSPYPGASLHCGDPKGGFVLWKPKERGPYDSGSFSPLRYMRSAPAEGYSQNLILPDPRATSDCERLFYFKCGPYFGKGSAVGNWDDGDVIEASVTLLVNTSGTRTVTTQ